MKPAPRPNRGADSVDASESGLDYGVRPHYFILGDIEFPSLLARSLRGFGFGVVRQFGAMADTPALRLSFTSESDARELFRRFRAWSSEGFYARGVRFSFMEFPDGSFGLSVVQDPDALRERLQTRALVGEAIPLVMAVGYATRCPKMDQQYRAFQIGVRDRPVLITAESATGPLPECILRQETLPYYREGRVPEDAFERALFESRGVAKEDALRPRGDLTIPTAEAIHERRRKQMRRFFPFSLERLRTSDAFGSAVKDLEREGYRRWQVCQAACNLTLPSRFPDHFDTSTPQDGSERRRGGMDVLERLLGSHESPEGGLSVSGLLEPGALREQIAADARYLLGWLAAGTGADPPLDFQAALTVRGMLGEPT